MEKENKERIINMRQTSKYQNGKVLFELNDDLKRAGYDEKEKKQIRDTFGKIHARYSGFRVVARDYSNGTGDKMIDLELRLGPEEVKSISEDILEKINTRKSIDLEMNASKNSGVYFKNSINEKKKKLELLTNNLNSNTNTTEIAKIKQEIEQLKDDIAFAKMSFANAQCNYQMCVQKIELMSEKVFYEQKISPNKLQNSQYSNVTALTIEYNTKMKAPWTIVVENGLGIREQTQTGGYKIKSGSYKDGKRVRLFLSDNDIRKLFRKAADYVRSWETTNQAAASKQRAEYEKQDRTNFESSKNN